MAFLLLILTDMADEGMGAMRAPHGGTMSKLIN
jgi:hypothetical protein